MCVLTNVVALFCVAVHVVETKAPCTPSSTPNSMPFSLSVSFSPLPTAGVVDPDADTEQEDNDPDLVERLAPNDVCVSMLGRLYEQVKLPLK